MGGLTTPQFSRTGIPVAVALVALLSVGILGLERRRARQRTCRGGSWRYCGAGCIAADIHVAEDRA